MKLHPIMDSYFIKVVTSTVKLAFASFGKKVDWVSLYKPRAPYSGPRMHIRKGHMRKMANGKEVWVKSCTVGKPVQMFYGVKDEA